MNEETQPIFEGFTIEFGPTVARNTNSLKKDLEIMASFYFQVPAKKFKLERRFEWKIAIVSLLESPTVEILPPKNIKVSIQQAWDIAYELQELPDIVDATPLFEIVQPVLSEVTSFGNAPDWMKEQLESHLTNEEATLAETDECKVFDPTEPDWSIRFIKAENAWNATGGTNQSKILGEGIRIAHPDTGYRRHRELTEPLSKIDRELQYDFVNEDKHAETDSGNHGLGTGTVIVSSDNRNIQRNSITGVAPEAQLIPLRVMRLNSPILFWSSNRRLRKAIEHCIKHNKENPTEAVSIISMSLGGIIRDRSLHRIIKKATENNIIVLAASGNFLRNTVWPAKYTEVIAVGGCTSKCHPWTWSSRGPEVDISGPAEKVWRAIIDNDQELVVGNKGNGTSFAVASVAGVAALWLAKHGRQNLINHCQGELTLTALFRKILVETATPFPENARDNGEFGAGIVNAEAVLNYKLPNTRTTRSSSSYIEMQHLKSEPAKCGGGIERITETFDHIDVPAMKRFLSETLRIPEENIENKLSGLGDELTFHLITDPYLRRQCESEITSEATLKSEALYEKLFPKLDISNRLKNAFQ